MNNITRFFAALFIFIFSFYTVMDTQGVSIGDKMKIIGEVGTAFFSLIMIVDAISKIRNRNKIKKQIFKSAHPDW